MGRARTNTHKSKANKKSTTEVKHHTSPETRKRTSYLQKKGTGKDAVFSSKKQKVSCNKRSEKNEENDQSDKQTGNLKKTRVNSGTSPKENRKRESSKLAPHLSAKIVPVFGKKRQSVQSDDVKASESQQSLENVDSDIERESKVDTASAVEEKVDEESMPEHASIEDKVGLECRECDSDETERGVKVQMTSDAACDDSKSDSDKEKKDKRESMSSNESTSDIMETDTTGINCAATEEVIEVQPIKHADVDESKVKGEEQKNNELVTRLTETKVVDAEAPCVTKEATSQCTSETMEDHIALSSPHDCIIKEEDIAVSKRESINIGLDKVLNSPLKDLEDSVKAGTEHGIQRNEIFTTTNGTTVPSGVPLFEVDDEQGKEDKEEVSLDETGKQLLVSLNTAAPDTSLDKGNLPVSTQHRKLEDKQQIEPKPELSELDHALQVQGDGNDDNHPFEKEMKDDGKVNEPPQVESKSEIKSTPSNTKDTNHELPERSDTLVDGFKVEVKWKGGVEATVTSSEETGDPIFVSTILQGDLQCTTSTEDVNSLRRVNTPIYNSKHAESDNQNENKVKNNIQDEMEGCRDQLCGSTQEFEVGMQNQPYTSPCDDAPMSCDDFGISGKVHMESTHRGDMDDVVHTDSGTDEQMNTSTSPLDAQHSIAKQATNLDTTHNDLEDRAGEMDIAENKTVTVEARESEQGKDNSLQLPLYESTEQFCSLEGDPLVDDMMDLTDSQMIELGQCSMTSQLSDPSLTTSAVTLEFSSGEPPSKASCSVGVQTVNDSTECSDSTSIVQSMIKDLRQLKGTQPRHQTASSGRRKNKKVRLCWISRDRWILSVGRGVSLQHHQVHHISNSTGRNIVEHGGSHSTRNKWQ